MPLSFAISINRLYPGEKLSEGDSRWGTYNGAFHMETHTTDSLLAEVRLGYAFCCVLGACNDKDCKQPNGYRMSRHFATAQHIGLDFDTEDDQSSLRMLEQDSFIADHAGLLYTTISHTPEKPRARALFILNEPITNPATYRLYKAALIGKYDISDSSVVDEARLFYGSRDCDYRNLGKILYLEVLKELAEEYLARVNTAASKQRRNVPPLPDSQVTGDTAAERYVNRALQEEVAWLASREAGRGERHPGLLVAAIKLESLRQSGWLPHEVREKIDVYAELLPAAQANGYTDKYGEEPTRRVIADGISYARPRPQPDTSRAYSGDHQSFRTSESSMSGGSEETRKLVVIPSKIVPLPEAGASQGLLEPFIPDPSALVLLSGESSAGKTVLAYNLAYHLAEGSAIAGLTPSRAIRVLYFDIETPESVYRSQVNTVGRSGNLAFVRNLPESLNTAKGRAAFLGACREYNPDVVILDPLPVAWPVKDENDNAEADAQMWAIKQMAVDLNCVIIALWNMGEGNVKDKYKARGATARIDRSDVALNYSEVTDTSRQLKIVKSRYGTLGVALTLKFAGDMGFEVVYTQDDVTPSTISQFQQNIRGLMNSGQTTRQQLVKALGNEDLVDKAIHKMVLAGELTRVKRGEYAAQVSSEPPDYRGSDSEEPLLEDEREVYIGRPSDPRPSP